MPDDPIEMKQVPVNFLLCCSEGELGNFQLLHLSQATNIGKQLNLLLEQMVDERATAALARWFRSVNREMLKKALDTPEDALEWAREQIRCAGRKAQELLPTPPAEPGVAHRAASLAYQKRNLSAGKCRVCPQHSTTIACSCAASISRKNENVRAPSLRN